MMRVPWYFWSVSLQTYQSRALVSLPLRLARLNQGCWSEVWLRLLLSNENQRRRFSFDGVEHGLLLSNEN